MIAEIACLVSIVVFRLLAVQYEWQLGKRTYAGSQFQGERIVSILILNYVFAGNDFA